ncbi:FKBP-type peptidyl-prolyl cis-trans isomerase [Flavobacterium collinsii]|uniref:FKBP-type peptidyl-prolyl cis-trans isomerase n=1 Tax=Flavobacterium collinsii TaxID=1114861 RepID=UPI003756A3A9
MNKFKYYFILLLAGVSLVSCNKKDDDETEIAPLKDYQEQFNIDNANIEEYLKTNYITVVNKPGDITDQDVTFTKITDVATQPSIMSYLNSATFPKLLMRDVDLHGIKYKMYYLVLREGTGLSPLNTDGVLTAYKGEYLKRVEKTATDPEKLTTTLFEQVIYTNETQDLYGVIMGWSEIFPQFKIGTSTTNADGSIIRKDFGAGVLFVPSGLGYYANPPASSSIPAYSPLIFTIKLYDLKRLDHENNGYSASTGALIPNPDGLLDYQEDINGDGYVYDYRNTTLYPKAPKNLDDTDGDGIPDFLDQDDDNDGFTTRYEITKPLDAPYSGLSKYYPYDPILDNPSTPNVNESEIWGVPRRPRGALADPAKPESITNPRKFISEDYTAPGRTRIHLDNTYPYKQN